MTTGISFKPSDAVEGGGLLDDEDVKVLKSRIVMFDYGGKAQPAPAIMWELERMDGSESVTQYWSVGKATDWLPSDDGKQLVAIGRATNLVNSSNGMMLITSLVNAGLPENRIGEDISIFEGLECHMNRVAAKREGLDNTKNSTVLTVTKIIKLPWEKSTKGKGKSKTTSKGGATAPEDSSDNLEAIATEFVLKILADSPDGIEKAKLAPKAFQEFSKDDPNRAALVQLLFKDDFLNAGPWKYEGGKLSM